MGNQTSIKIPHEAKLESSKDIRSPFENVTPLPVPLSNVQCVTHKQEIIICGGSNEKLCYSYNTITNQYKLICSYPENFKVIGQSVVKLMSNNKDTNTITLLSVGGQGAMEEKSTWIMNYVSVWNEKLRKPKNCNKWVPFTDNNDNQISIGRIEDNYFGVRTVIGGSNNNLLFITYLPKNIDVFDLRTFQYIKYGTLPTEYSSIHYHCFVPNVESTMSNKEKNEMILLCQKAGILIKYNEGKNTFQFHKLWVCTTIKSLFFQGWVFVKDVFLFFGGCADKSNGFSDIVYKYSISRNKWVKCEKTWPISLRDCTGVWNEDTMYLHIIGGSDGDRTVTTHIRINLQSWMKEEETEIERLWISEEEEKRDLEENKIELDEMKNEIALEKLKV
ncbi:hypothetical protein RFI_09315, partial [Reticulomyxa filosa]